MSVSLFSATVLTPAANTSGSPTGATASATSNTLDTTTTATLRLTLSIVPTFAPGAGSPVACDVVIETSEIDGGPWRELARAQVRHEDSYSKRFTVAGCDKYTRARASVSGPQLKSAAVTLGGDAL